MEDNQILIKIEQKSQDYDNYIQLIQEGQIFNILDENYKNEIKKIKDYVQKTIDDKEDQNQQLIVNFSVNFDCFKKYYQFEQIGKGYQSRVYVIDKKFCIKYLIYPKMDLKGNENEEQKQEEYIQFLQNNYKKMKQNLSMILLPIIYFPKVQIQKIPYFFQQQGTDFYQNVMGIEIYKLYPSNLKQYLKNSKHLQNLDIQQIFFQIVQGRKEFGFKAFLNLDIKLENILIDDDLKIQFIDLQETIFIDEFMEYSKFKLAESTYKQDRQSIDFFALAPFYNNNFMEISIDQFKNTSFKIGEMLSQLNNYYLNKQYQKLNGYPEEIRNQNKNKALDFKKKLELKIKDARNFSIDKQMQFIIQNLTDENIYCRMDIFDLENLILYEFNWPCQHLFTQLQNKDKSKYFNQSKEVNYWSSQQINSEQNKKSLQEINEELKQTNIFLSVVYSQEFNNLLKNAIDKQPEQFNIDKFFDQEILKYDKYGQIIKLVDGFKNKQLTNQEKYKQYLMVIENLIKLYSLETQFYKKFNECLNNEQFYELNNYLYIFQNNFFNYQRQIKQHIQLQNNLLVKDSIVYRGIGVQNSLDSIQYSPGIIFYWKSFTSTSKKKQIALKFCNQSNCDYKIIFEISLNLNNQSNKQDISCFSKYQNEEEVLLLPFFRFQVKSTYPIREKEKNIKVIQIEEVIQRFLWVDEKINNAENSKMQKNLDQILKEFNPLYLDSFEDALKRIKEEQKIQWIVMSSGSGGQTFFPQIDNLLNVDKLILYCLNYQYHSQWFSQEKYQKFGAIYTTINELNQNILLQCLPILN